MATKFYYDTNALTERSDIPFCVTNPDGLDVRASDFKVVLGGDAVGAGGEIVITKALADNYVANTDITGGHMTDNPVNAARWINGAGL